MSFNSVGRVPVLIACDWGGAMAATPPASAIDDSGADAFIFDDGFTRSESASDCDSRQRRLVEKDQYI